MYLFILITDKMQLGPAPVEAVRRGDLGMGYDVDFVYSEVNADVQTFLADPNIDWGFRFGSSNVLPSGVYISNYSPIIIGE